MQITFKTPEKLREYKREYMRKRRANPDLHEKMKAQTRTWYKASGRDKRQKLYLHNMRIEQFVKWKVKMFNQHHGTQYIESDFQQLLDAQGGVCPFTGRIINNTAHIDHIIPIKRGGGHDLSNLRWVCREVNYMKRDMLDSEFINLVDEIVRRLTETI